MIKKFNMMEQEKISKTLLENYNIDPMKFWSFDGNPTEFQKTMMLDKVISICKMNLGLVFEKQLFGFIQYAQDNKIDRDEVIFTLYHDLMGGFHKQSFFVPRIKGYEEYLENPNKF